MANSNSKQKRARSMPDPPPLSADELAIVMTILGTAQGVEADQVSSTDMEEVAAHVRLLKVSAAALEMALEGELLIYPTPDGLAYELPSKKQRARLKDFVDYLEAKNQGQNMSTRTG